MWQLKTYSIGYDANGGENAPTAQTKTHFEDLTLSNEIPTREGYDFLGWATDAEAKEATFQPGSNYSAEGNATLYAVWQLKTYAVTYDANGGENAPAAQTKTHFEDLTLSSEVPTREGYDFLGWATEADATEAVYEAGAGYAAEGNATLYAVWQLKTYSITYDANGGENAPTAQTKTHFEDLTLSNEIPTREGYDFLGWATDAEAMEAEYQPGSNYIAEGNAMLYAVWQLKTYTISYDANGGEGALESQTKTHGVILILSENIPYREYYDFLGWATDAEATEAAYEAGAGYAAEGNATLYAVWARSISASGFSSEGLKWTLYEDGELVIEPETVGGAGTILEAPWSGYAGAVKKLTITSGVTEIGNGAFSDCTELTDITIPAGVTAIGDNAFAGCTSVTEIIIPGSVTEIGDGAFSGCTSLTDITIPNGVTVIGDNAFANCTKLTEIIIPGSVTEIGDGAFSGCTGLTNVIIEDGVNTIGDNAFTGCTGLKAVTIPGSVTKIGNDAFSDCAGLTNVTVQDGVSIIGDNAFSNCKNLTDVSIPESVTEIGRGAFSNCPNLTNIAVPNGATVAEDAFSGSPEPLTKISLDHDYIAMRVGETAEIKAAVPSGDEVWLQSLQWSVETIEAAEEDGTVISVKDGTVEAVGKGAAYVVASVNGHDGKPSAVDRCRVDVVEDTGEHAIYDSIAQFRLLTTKATVELYKTEYTQIHVIPEIVQNMTKMRSFSMNAAGTRGVTQAEDSGVAIKSAVFTDSATAARFSLRVVDDRTLEIIPNPEYVTTDAAILKTIKNSYVSTIKIVVDEGRDPFVTAKLTLTVKKTVPKVTAKAVALNSFYESTQNIVFSGGTVEEVRLNPNYSVPAWIRTDGRSITYTGSLNAKVSGKLYLLTKLKGWALERPVTVSVSAVKSVPKITLKSATLSMQPGKEIGDHAQTTFTVTPAALADAGNYSITVSSIYEGKTPINNDKAIKVSIEGQTIRVEEGMTPPVDGKLHTYQVNLGFKNDGTGEKPRISEAKVATLTVKILASATKPTLTVTTSGTIDLAVEASPMKLVPTLKNVGTKGTYEITAIRNAAGEDKKSSFNVDSLTLTAGKELTTGKYTATVTATYGESGSVSKNVTFTVKRSSSKIPASGVTIKTSGSIDVVKPGSYVTITPTIKNYYLHMLKESDLVFCKVTGKTATPIANEEDCPFQVELVGTKFRVSLKPGVTVNHLKAKYSVYMKLDNGKTSAKATVNLKMSTAKVTQSVKSVSLVKTDRFSRGTVVIRVTTTGLSPIDWEKTASYFVSPKDSKGNPFFTLKVLENGTCAICYTDNAINPSVKAGTVKIPVYLEGNISAKANATVSVSVKLS